MSLVFIAAPAALCLIAASTLYIHLRGQERLVFRRQVADHSTFLAPYNCLVYLFSGVESTPIPDVEEFPRLRPLRDQWRTMREEAAALYEAGTRG